MNRSLTLIVVTVCALVLCFLGCEENDSEGSYTALDNGSRTNSPQNVDSPDQVPSQEETTNTSANVAGIWHLSQHYESYEDDVWSGYGDSCHIYQSGADIMVLCGMTVPDPTFSPNGSVSGDSVNFSFGEEVFTGTVTPDGNTMTGTCHKQDDSGIWQATRDE